MDELTRRNLEEQRDFLLASLRDLERERVVGDVDDADYQALRSSYTARAADIIRRLDGDALGFAEPAEPGGTKRRVPRRLVGVLLVVAVAAGLGVFVARQSGQRLPGETASGGIADSTANKLAINIYSEVLKVDPDNVEALTYRSWLLALTARDAEQSVLDAAVQTAIVGLGRATLLDDSYPDAHCFLGIVSYRFANDLVTAKSALAKCQAADPPAQVKSFVDAVVAEVEAAG
jgi:hypothetical protein